MFSLRRLPTVVSRTVADSRLTSALDQLTGEGALGDASDDTCLAVSDPSGRSLYARRVDQPLIPASSLKLVTGAVALAKIGGDTRLTTEVRAPAALQGGTVADLWLVGGGDPLLATADFAADGGYLGQPRLATPMEDLADRVVAAGIRTVQGRVVGDDSRYDDQRLVPTWLPRYIANFDVGPISALTVNEGLATFPPAPSYALSPANLAADVLTGLLRARGVTVGGTGAGTAPAATTLVASIDSPPLAEVVGAVLQHSDNMGAEMLVKELGVRFGGAGSTAAGLAVIRDHLAASGAPLAGVATVDGSGLDRSDHLTCQLLQQVLATAGDDSELARGLPVAGPQRHPLQALPGHAGGGQGPGQDGFAARAWPPSPASPPAPSTDAGAGSLRFSLLANELPTEAAGLAPPGQRGRRPRRLPPGARRPTPSGPDDATPMTSTDERAADVPPGDGALPVDDPAPARVRAPLPGPGPALRRRRRRAGHRPHRAGQRGGRRRHPLPRGHPGPAAAGGRAGGRAVGPGPGRASSASGSTGGCPTTPTPGPRSAPSTASRPAPTAADHRHQVERLLRRVLALKAELGESATPATVVLDPDPALAAWQAAALAPLGPFDAQRVLELGSGRRPAGPGGRPPGGRGNRACATGGGGIGTRMATRAQAKQTRAKGTGRRRPPTAASSADVSDLWQLVVAYFKQETIEPIKGLGRFVGWGLAGSLAVGLGGVMIVLGLLRLLQTVDAFDGNWSFIPYLVTLTVAAGGTLLAVSAGNKDRKKAKA